MRQQIARLQRRRNTDVGDICMAHIAAATAHKNVAVGQVPHDLFGKERVAGGALAYRRRDLRDG